MLLKGILKKMYKTEYIDRPGHLTVAFKPRSLRNNRDFLSHKRRRCVTAAYEIPLEDYLGAGFRWEGCRDGEAGPKRAKSLRWDEQSSPQEVCVRSMSSVV